MEAPRKASLMQKTLLRTATPEDAACLRAVYAPYVTDTAITFEYDVPDVEEFRTRIRNICRTYPYLVCEREGRVAGYAYAHRHMERAAYQWNAELSVYVEQSLRGRGLGFALYSALLDLLRLQGVHNVYGCVTTPNPRSEKLHARLGFHLVGVQHAAGYKLGQWHDVSWFEKRLTEATSSPPPIKPFQELDAATTATIFKKSAAAPYRESINPTRRRTT